jgi:hypothetical protein
MTLHFLYFQIYFYFSHPHSLQARDLCVGYGLACASYVLIGTSFFVAFPLGRRCIADNLLNNFGPGDLLSATTRVFLLFQVLFF